MLHTYKFYQKQYEKYISTYKKLHKTYGSNMARAYTADEFESYYKTADMLGMKSSVTQEAKGAIYTTKKQASNIADKLKDGIRLARQKQANGEQLSDLEKKLADTNITDINVKDVRAKKGAAGEILDMLDDEDAWKTAVGSI